jgi:hypothetical protein
LEFQWGFQVVSNDSVAGKEEGKNFEPGLGICATSGTSLRGTDAYFYSVFELIKSFYFVSLEETVFVPSDLQDLITISGGPPSQDDRKPFYSPRPTGCGHLAAGRNAPVNHIAPGSE